MKDVIWLSPSLAAGAIAARLVVFFKRRPQGSRVMKKRIGSAVLVGAAALTFGMGQAHADDPRDAPGYSASDLAVLKATQPEGLVRLEKKVCTTLDDGVELATIESQMMHKGMTVKQTYTVVVDAVMHYCGWQMPQLTSNPGDDE